MAKKQKKKSYLKKEKIILTSVFGALVVAVAGFFVYQAIASNYYVKINGEPITSNEIKLNMYNYKSYYDQMGITDFDTVDENGMSGLQTIIQYTVNDVIESRIKYNEAVKRGITITDEQRQKALDNVTEIKEYMGEVIMKDVNMTDEQLTDYMEKLAYIENLKNSITDTYVFDQAAFDEYFKTYQVDNRQTLATYNVDYVVTENEDDANNARTRLLDGEDYETVYKEMSVDYAEGVEIKTKSVTELNLGQAIIDAVFALNPGEATEPVAGDESGFTVAILRNIVEPNLAEVEPEAKDQYIYEQKEELYKAEIEKWAEASNIDVNPQKLYSLTFPPDAVIPTQAPVEPSETEGSGDLVPIPEEIPPGTSETPEPEAA